jgi:hypothetical protein
VGQRVFAIALGYEDLNDHDELHHDPLMAVLAGKLAARRSDCILLGGAVITRSLSPPSKCDHCALQVGTNCTRQTMPIWNRVLLTLSQ